MGKVNVGVIGCGDVALLQYLPVIKKSRILNLVALCDKNEERLKKVADLFGIDNIFTSYVKLLRSGIVSAIANLTPLSYHYPINRDCLDAKIHTFSEKPIATNIDEIEDIIEISKKNRVKFVCAPATPISPVLTKTKQLLTKGVIGKVCYAIASFSHGGPASQGYNISYYKNLIKENKLYGFEDLSTDPVNFYKEGGVLEDLGVYTLASLIYLFGSVKYVQSLEGTKIPEVKVEGGIAKGKKIKVKIKDCSLLLLEFNKEVFASTSNSYCVKGTKIPSIEIYGSKGTISITQNFTEMEVFLENDGIAAWNRPYESLSAWSLGMGVEHMAECILENKEPILSANLAKHIMEIIIKSRQASLSGKKILIGSHL